MAAAKARAKHASIERRLTAASSLADGELVALTKDINVEAAGEISIARREHYANVGFLNRVIALAALAQRGRAHPAALRNIVSAVGFLCTRYALFDEHAFLFLADHIHHEADIVRIAVAKNLYKFPQFATLSGCWTYVLTMPETKPKKESIAYFARAIVRHRDVIPPEHLFSLAAALRAYAADHPDEHAVRSYLALAEELSGGRPSAAAGSIRE